MTVANTRSGESGANGVGKGATTPAAAREHAIRVGEELGSSLRSLFGAIPDCELSPTAVARRLGMSRVIVSKLLGALGRSNPVALLQDIPGPESLRVAATVAAAQGVDASIVAAAESAIDAFALLIREEFGTRSALNAALGAESEDLRVRQENASRYDVFKGMRQILGVEAETWLTSMLFYPSTDDAETVAVTTIHGALGMRRLRPDTPVSFTFGSPHRKPDEPPDPMRSPIGLQEFYTHDAAALDTRMVGDKLVHELADNSVGRRALADMLAVSHNPRGSRRYATPERRLGGVALFVDIPVKMLVCDALVHDSIFPDSEPELIVYNPGLRGPANPNDPSRNIDRVTVPERIATIGKGDGRFDLAEVPNYGAMVSRVCAMIGHAPSSFRVCRLLMAYPVHGFQFVIAFQAPERPAP